MKIDTHAIIRKSNATTNVLFVITVSFMMVVIFAPVFANSLSEPALRFFGQEVLSAPSEEEANALRRDWGIWVLFSAMSLFFFLLLVVSFYKKWLKKSLHDCSPNKMRPKGLSEVSAGLYDTCVRMASKVLPSTIGKVHFVVNERTTESFVVGRAQYSWVAMSIAHLTQPLKKFSFVLMHELAHIVNNDHRMLGWSKAILKAGLIVFVINQLPLTMAALLAPETLTDERVRVMTFDFSFVVVLFFFMIITVGLLKKREFAADLLAKDWLEPDDYVVLESDIKTKRTSVFHSWLSTAGRLIFGNDHHPSLRQRYSLYHDPKAFFRPLASLSVFAGFATILLGIWGTPPPEIMDPGYITDERAAALVFHPQRFILLFLGVALVASDMALGLTSGKDLVGKLVKSFLWFCSAGIPMLFMNVSVAIITARPLIPAVLTAVVQVVIFAPIFIVFVGVAVWPSVKRSSANSGPWYSDPAVITSSAPLILYLIYISVFPGYDIDDLQLTIGSAVLFLVFMLPVLFFLGRVFYSERFQGIFQEAGLRQEFGEIREGSVWGIFTIIGGIMGGLVFSTIYIVLSVWNMPDEQLLNPYSVTSVYVSIGVLTGVLAGSLRWIFARASSPRKSLLISLVLLAIIILFMPFIVDGLFAPVGIAIGLWLADRWMDRRKFLSKIRYRVLLVLGCTALITVPLAPLLQLFLISIGFPPATERIIGGAVNALSTGGAITLASVRSLMDALLAGFFISFTICAFEEVFGKPKLSKETLFEGGALQVL